MPESIFRYGRKIKTEMSWLFHVFFGVSASAIGVRGNDTRARLMNTETKDSKENKESEIGLL